MLRVESLHKSFSGFKAVNGANLHVGKGEIVAVIGPNGARKTTLFNLVTGIIDTFQVFTAGYVMTSGGPNNASLFYVLYLYRNAWEYLAMGYASALAWILFLVIMFFTALILRSSSMWVHYEGVRAR